MRNTQDYLNEIREYYYRNVLFASDKVILAIKNFIVVPNQENYVKTAKAMRKYLLGNKTKIKMDDLVLNTK